VTGERESPGALAPGLR